MNQIKATDHGDWSKVMCVWSINHKPLGLWRKQIVCTTYTRQQLTLASSWAAKAVE